MSSTNQKLLSVETIVLAREHLAVDRTSPSGLRWKSHWSNKHQHWAEKPAGNRKSNGYWQVHIAGRRIHAHRLVWFLCTGIDNAQWNRTIDHIDRNPSNNRIENLRTATHSEQMKNRDYYTKPGSKIGGSGLRWVGGKGNGWRGEFKCKNKRIHCGCFRTPEEAHKAVLAKRRSMGLPCP